VLRYVVPGGHLALLAELEAEHGRVCIACTHLRWQSADTPEDQHLGCSQMRELLSYRREFASEDARWILAGDFNATPNSSVVNAARASGLSLGCELQRPWHTVNINGRKRKLDYLLYTRSSLRASPLSLPTLSTDTPMPSETHASDHLPVVVRFRFM